MATATRKSSNQPSPRDPKGKSGKDVEVVSPFLRAFDHAFRFLASLKLAMLSLGTLVVYLTVGMFFERSYGNQALQDYFYRTWYFALLLGVLGLNILCAALIRYPWKKRQTGFVVTHAGLLVLIVGSWIGFQVGDEGQMGMVEGDSSATLVRTTHYRIRVQPIDSATRRPTGDGMSFPFYPGAFNWKPGRVQTLTRPQDPFRLDVTAFYPASVGKLQYTKTPEGGLPMVRLGASLTPPGAASPIDLFANDTADQTKWLIADAVFNRKARSIGPALFRFSYVDGKSVPEAVADFLELPESGKVECARIRYTDRSGRERTVQYFPAKGSWFLGSDQIVTGRALELPDSDLKITYKLSGTPGKPEVFERLKTEFHLGSADSHSHIRLIDFLMTILNGTGERELPFAEFEVSRGSEPPVVHWAMPVARVSTLGFKPSDEDPKVLEPTDALLNISYYMPPTFSEGMEGTKGVIDVLGTSEGRLYYRTMNDEGIQGQGRLKLGEETRAFGGTPNQPVSMSFRVDEFLQSGRQEFVFVPITMPVGQAGNGIPAARVRLSKGGQSEYAWIRLGITPDLKPDSREAQTLTVGGQSYQVWFDVDRKELPFEIQLVDFQRRFDPGTQQAKSFESEVLLSDEEQGLRGKKVNISMNEPLTHRNYTFYQSSFDPPSDSSGQFISVFQVRYDPTWSIVYLGCLMVVIGTFLQFYMRAGIFTDGGKRERERSEQSRSRGSSPVLQAEAKTVDSPSKAEPLADDL